MTGPIPVVYKMEKDHLMPWWWKVHTLAGQVWWQESDGAVEAV